MGWCLLVLWISPWVGGLLLATLGKRWGRWSGLVAVVSASLSALATLWLGIDLGKGAETGIAWEWIPSEGIDFALRLDSLSLPFLDNTLGVSIVALVYGLGYLRADGRLHLCYALLLGFMGSMVSTCLANDLFLFFVSWETMLVTSSLLLAGWGEGEHVGRVTLKYFIYTQVGSLLVLVAIIILAAETGGSNIAALAGQLHLLSQGQLVWLAVLMTVGFCVKLAVFPLHTWLPDAHSIAPMPVTVMLAAAMLSMGAYGILRRPMATLGIETMRSLQLPVMILALASQFYGALMSLSSRDIKRIVAYSSVSQMGYVLFGFASLTPSGVAGGTFHIISHGILKALMFMGVGLIMRGTGRRRIDALGGLADHMPRVALGLAVGAIALSGMPPFCAFHGEWMIFSGGIASDYPLLGYLELLVPLFTAAYALWFVGRLVFNPPPPDLEVTQNPRSMRWSFQALALLALLVGLYPTPIYRWVGNVVTLLGLGG